jgi:Inner membrane protein YgaP-like, transmembrane domain
MTTERAVRLLAGSLVAVSLLLGYLVTPAWLLLATFVALNLIQSAFTGFCPAEKMLRRLGTHDAPLPQH